MPDLPIVYMEVGFFLSFLKKIEVPFYQIAEKDNLLFVQKLLTNRAKICVDLEQEEINQIMLFEKTPILYDKAVVFGIKEMLSKVNRVDSCKENLSLLKGNNPESWKEIKKPGLPHFLLLDCDENEAITLQNRIGVICISKDLEFNSCIYEMKIKPIVLEKQLRASINVNDFTSFLPQSFSLIIEDPYFYINAIKLNQPDFLEELLQNLYNINFRNRPFEVLLIVPDEEHWENKSYRRNQENIEKFKTSYNRLEERITIINKEHKGRLHLEVHKNKSYKMHDRNILSNTFWISCGHSFQREYNTNTEWTYRPLGIFFSMFKTRVEFASKFIKTQFLSTNNRLVNGLV